MARPLVIAVDGPAAAGKGTLARRLAESFGLAYLDTGLLYRAVGRRVLDAGADPTDPRAALAAAVALEEADLARGDLRHPDTDLAASRVASVPAVRQALLAYQRRFPEPDGAVLDGRDIGTVIFPDARVKLYVTASVEARARRRWLELSGRGIAAELVSVAQDIRDRDAADAARIAAPLRRAEDAILIDTTALDQDAAFARARDAVAARLAQA